MVNKLILGWFCLLFMVRIVIGFMSSWISGLAQIVMCGAIMFLLFRALRKEMTGQSKIFLVLGITFLSQLLSVGAYFLLLH